jgi:hypothetical protein
MLGLVGSAELVPQSATLLAHSPASVRYVLSDGFDLRASLSFEANGRYEFHWDGCLGSIAQSSGRYAVNGAAVSLAPDPGSFRRDPRVFANVMRRVGWASREYLIPEERMLAFANAINAGREPRSTGFGLFYLRDGDETKLVEGMPDLGPKWNAYLLPEPLAGTVVRVEQRETSTQRPIVVLGAGSRLGLREGMELFASNPRRPHFRADLTILTVEVDSARAVVPFQYNHIGPCDVWRSRGAAQQSDAADERRVASCLRGARS